MVSLRLRQNLEWRKNATSRVDFVIIDRQYYRDEDYPILSKELHKRLRLLTGLEVKDHLPLAWTFRHYAWTPPARTSPQFDANAMVRSCLTWDDRAIQYAETMQNFLLTTWYAQRPQREQSGLPAIQHMADMTWRMEEHMNTTAGAIWPPNNNTHKVPYSDADKKWFAWQGILRREAWKGTLATRDSLIEANNNRTARGRVVESNHKGHALRITSGALWTQGGAITCLFKVWAAYRHYHRVHSSMEKYKGYLLRTWDNDIPLQISKAKSVNDTRQMWRLMRTLSGTGRRERKRNIKDVHTMDPTLQEWEVAMRKPGADGGCCATSIARVPEDSIFDRKEVITIPSHGMDKPINCICTGQTLLETLQNMKYMRAVPQGRARKELYQMLMEFSTLASTWYAGLLNVAYNTSHTLGTWELADAAQLDKHNNKEGTAGIRLIMMLDPIGKAYYWKLHEQTKDKRTNIGYGFYDNRRREQAILIQHAVTGRLRVAASTTRSRDKSMYSFVTTYRDISNAFPSITHDALNNTIKETTDPWTATQLSARHQELQARITTKQGAATIIKPNTGGAQGDKVMPVQFRRTYEAHLMEWISLTHRDLNSEIKATDPNTGTIVDVSTTCYADDVKELNMVTNARDAIETIARSTTLMDQIIGPIGLAQNKGKTEHVATFLGTRQDPNTKALKATLTEAGLGDLKQGARYLGAWPQYNGTTQVTVDKRCRAAKEAYYSLGGSWRKPIPLPIMHRLQGIGSQHTILRA